MPSLMLMLKLNSAYQQMSAKVLSMLLRRPYPCQKVKLNPLAPDTKHGCGGVLNPCRGSSATVSQSNEHVGEPVACGRRCYIRANDFPKS